MKVASGDAIQLMQVYRADKPSKHVQVATITYPVEASAATRRDVHNQAGSFMVNAKGVRPPHSQMPLRRLLSSPRVAAIAQGDRTIRGLEDSREVARWAYGAKRATFSAIFNVGKDYVIATLTEIDDNEYAPLNKVSAQIRSQLLRDKKYDYIVKSLSGSTLAEQAASLGSGGGGLLRCDFRFVLRERRGHGASSGGRHRIGREGCPVGSREGDFRASMSSRSGMSRPTTKADRRRRKFAQAMAEPRHGPAVRHPAIQQMAQDLRGKYFKRLILRCIFLAPAGREWDVLRYTHPPSFKNRQLSPQRLKN